jgi:hypothetical protein
VPFIEYVGNLWLWNDWDCSFAAVEDAKQYVFHCKVRAAGTMLFLTLKVPSQPNGEYLYVQTARHDEARVYMTKQVGTTPQAMQCDRIC